MKKLLVKIKNKKLKGNISLLVILILLASSVISLLSINQIQRLLTYGNMTFNYFRSFYLAKAGTELGLTEVYHRGDGFNHHIASGSAIVTGNLIPEYAGFEPYFDMTITGSFYTITEDIRNSECNGNKIKLTSGAGIMLSLFSDDNGDKELNTILSDSVSNKKLDNITDLSLEGYNGDSELTFAFFTYGEEYMEDIVVATGGNLSNFLRKPNVQTLIESTTEKKYLTIKNSGDEDVEFCITKNDSLIPYSDSLITVFGHYGDMEVGLQSIVKKQIPDWTLNVLGDSSTSS